MKALLISLTAVLCLLGTACITNSQAQDPLTAPSFTEFKMVASNDPLLSTSRIQNSSFGLNDTPYLYMKIAPAVTGSLRSYWTGPDLKERSRTRSITTASGTEFWFSLLYWNKDKQPGPWTVKGQLLSGTSLVDKAETSFVVTPEPLACVLYGLGGLPVLGRILRRKHTV
ncbi:MAG: hypothetical protein HGA80_03645 [Candidatus Omnitrophica bacterium]|nr:hypothetical protein [Candidatus Omnitrophota bacterium]